MTEHDIANAETRGAREHQFRTITLIFDNDEGAYRALRDATREEITSHQGLTLDEYRAAHGGNDRATWWSLGEELAEVVSNQVREWADEVPGVMGLLLRDLLDFGDSQLWTEIGWNFAAEPAEFDADDFAGYVAEEEDE